MIDILFLAHGRHLFTEASLAALRANTNWSLVRALWLYSDGPPGWPVACFSLDFTFDTLYVEIGEYGGPVAVMNDYLGKSPAETFAKVDNDAIVPPGWLDAALQVIEAHPELDLLGIEPPTSRTPSPYPTRGVVPAPAPELEGCHDGYAPCDAIGGIGLMRRSAFAGRDPMKPVDTYGGFTSWQIAHPEVRKGWIVPPLKVFLLDRLPIEPYVSLSRKYIAAGEQRPWTNYDPKDSDLWEWWLSDRASSLSVG